MSFSASAKRARDKSQPLALRVACLHECLERFNLFGYHATRDRLRSMVRAPDEGWTEEQVTNALDLLEAARLSWSTFSQQEHERRRGEKERDRTSLPPPRGAVFTVWLDHHLRGDVASAWLVGHLGDCEQCGHRLIHHGGYACGACGSDPGTQWESRCRAPLPPP